MEVEEEGELPFLDMLITRKGCDLSSTWYSKPTGTGPVMNFHSLAPIRYKRSVVGGFVHRIYRACSTWSNFHDIIEKAKDILEKNQYPPEFYNPIIKENIERLVGPTKQPTVQQDNGQQGNVKRSHRMGLQYRGSVTDHFVKNLRDCEAPVQTVITLHKIRSYLPPLKCEVPRMLKIRVVYKLTCPRCNACYVGQTGRHLLTRFTEHKNKSKQAVRMGGWENQMWRTLKFSRLRPEEESTCGLSKRSNSEKWTLPSIQRMSWETMNLQSKYDYHVDYCFCNGDFIQNSVNDSNIMYLSYLFRNTIWWWHYMSKYIIHLQYIVIIAHLNMESVALTAANFCYGSQASSSWFGRPKWSNNSQV